LTEEQLIKRCKNGDRDAFNELVVKYQDKVINMAYGMLSNRDDAFDAAQETFIKAYRGMGTFAEKSSFNTWLYRILANVCKDMLRKRQRTIKVVSIHDDIDDDAGPTQIPDTAPTPEEAVERTALQNEVWQALAKLKGDQRDIIVCFDMQGLSYEETAAALDCPVGTVKSRLNRARNALRKILSENREQN